MSSSCFLSDIHKFIFVLRQVCLQLRNILFSSTASSIISSETFLTHDEMTLFSMLHNVPFVSFFLLTLRYTLEKFLHSGFISLNHVFAMCNLVFNLFIAIYLKSMIVSLRFMNFENFLFIASFSCCCYCFCSFLVDLIHFLMSSKIV